MKRITQLFLMVSFIFCQSLSSQEASGQKINILSPNAESFKIYGDIPVSLYTGVPQISVPLHTIKTDYLNMDISLSYHASGFKPENHPSWVGLGWNLSAGGVINREIKGELDEMKSGNYAVNGLGYYYAYNILNKDNWYIPNDPSSTSNEFKLRYMDIDTQPDIFNFSFLGYSGKFYLNHLGEWKVECDAPIKVIFDKNDIGNNGDMFMSEHFRKFTIIDEKGVKYIFGGENAIEYSQSMFTNQNISYSYKRGWQAVSWYLTEIIPPTGEPIHFNYERGPYQSTFSCVGLNKPRKRAYQSSNVYDFILGDYIYGGASGSIMSPVYLSSINLPSENLTITFETSKSKDLIYPETNYRDFFYKDGNNGIPDPAFLAFDAVSNIPYFSKNTADRDKAQLSSGSGQFKDRFIWLKLDKILLKYNNNNLETASKNIQFSYAENTQIRRKLSSVTISYPSSNDPEIYSFEYNQSLPYNMTREPEYLSEYKDHWGYANNKFMWKEEDMTNEPKAPTKERAKLGMLNKIIYPTKGYTMFVYENHDYSAYIPSAANYTQEMSPTTAGGLRIKKIVNVSNSGKYTYREYFYDRVSRVGISSGILHARPSYYTSSGLLFDNSGAHITYASVIEKYQDRSFKATHFVTEIGIERLGEAVGPVFDDAPVYNAGDWIDVPSSRRDMEKGKVSDEYYCDSTGKVYKSIHYAYVNIGKTPSNYIRTLDPVYMKFYIPKQDESWGAVRQKKDASAFYYYCYSNKLSSVREIQYNKKSIFTYGNINMPSSNDIVMSSKKMEYDNNKQLTKESLTNSYGKVNYTITKYPYTEPGSDIHLKMVERNMLSYPVSQRKYANDYHLGGTDYIYSLLNDKDILLTSLKNIYSDNSSSINSELRYNNIGKLIEVKDNSGLCQSYLWDYNGRNVRLILDNVSSEDIKKEVPVGVIQCSNQNTDWNKLADQLRKTFSNSFIKQYDYNYKGNLSKIIKESSLSENFVYNKEERLETISDHDQRTVQKIEYNYKKENIAESIFFNQFITLSAQKQCPVGYIPQGASLKKDIPAGVYMSTISQEDADKAVWKKYTPELQDMADSQGKCIVHREITLLNRPGYTDIMTYRAHIEGDELIIDYIYLNWGDGFRYYNPSIFTGSVAVAQIADPKDIPKKSTFREYEMYGNTWTIWTEPSGYVQIRVSNAKNIWGIPAWGESFQVRDARFPLN